MQTPQQIIQQRLNPPKAFFTWCYRQIPTFVWQNKQETICASQRTDCLIITKRLTKRSNLSKPTKYFPFGIILVTKKRIEIQSYGFWSTVKEGKQTIVCELGNVERLMQDNHDKVHQWHKGECYEGLVSNYGFMSGPYTNTRFYPNHWRERIRTISELKYLTLPYLDYYDLENLYKYCHEIEFLQTIKAKKIAEEIMYPKYISTGGKYIKSVDMRTITMQWLRKNKKELKNYSQSFSTFQLEQLFKQRHSKLIEGIESFMTYRDVSKIPQTIGVIRFQRWLIKNKVTFNHYRDYLSLLQDLQVSLETERVLLPRDFWQAHDDAVEMLNTMKRELKEKEYEKRFKQVKKLEMEIGNYAIVAPK